MDSILYNAGIDHHAATHIQGTVLKIILSLIELTCALGILVGILELISERIAKLDRILPKVRLFRGFGCITVSSAIAMLVSFTHFVVLRKEGQMNNTYFLLMSIGALSCFIFCGLLLYRYKKIR